MQISSIRIQRARSEREKFGLPSHSGSIFLAPVLQTRWSGRNPPSPEATSGRKGCSDEPQNTLLALRQPLHEASNPQLMGFWGRIYIHLHGKLPPAPSRNTYCRFLQCRTNIVQKFWNVLWLRCDIAVRELCSSLVGIPTLCCGSRRDVFYAKFVVIEYWLRDPLQRLRQMPEMLHAEMILLHVLTNQSFQSISLSNLCNCGDFHIVNPLCLEINILYRDEYHFYMQIIKS